MREDIARGFAIERHGAQLYGDEPYEIHLRHVVGLLHAAEAPEDVIVAGWLHDVVEDTPTTLTEIVDTFGWYVAALVCAVTGAGKNRKERMTGVYARIRTLHERSQSAASDAVTLKLADRLANMQASLARQSKHLEMYRKEWPAFRQGLHPVGTVRLGRFQLWEMLEAAMQETPPQ